jgi:hypothetical protein
MPRGDEAVGRTVLWAFTAAGVVIGVVVAVVTSDVILGVIAGSAFVAITVGFARLWTGGATHHARHP